MTGMAPVDLAVVGAGLSGCALLSRLAQRGFDGSVALIEAGRGPGGRTATRRSRRDEGLRLDHGAPLLNLSAGIEDELAPLLQPLIKAGQLQRETRPLLGLDHQGGWAESAAHPLLSGQLWRGVPEMAAIAGSLMAHGPAELQCHFGLRLRWIERHGGIWLLADAEHNQVIEARRLVLSSNLLAHPRSLAMLAWPDVPLRSAVACGEDLQLDQALASIAGIEATVRWNLMLSLPSPPVADLPRQLWCLPEAQQRWGLERLVLQTQADGRFGVVLHGFDGGEAITPESQPLLLQQQERRQLEAWRQLTASWPGGEWWGEQAESLGVMRWGASLPILGALPQHLQWCGASGVGFCGDWIAGPGYGRCEGALHSVLKLADQLMEAN